MFAALGAEPRLRIMRLLLSAHPDGLVVGEIQAETGVAGSTLSHHLDKLKNDELVTAEREKAFIRYRANTEALRGAARVSVRRVLHAEQSRRAAENRRRSASSRGVTPWMHGTTSKDVVREKYGQAALARTRGERQLLLRRRRGARARAAIRSRRTCTTPGRKAKCRTLALQRLARAAAIRRRWPS